MKRRDPPPTYSRIDEMFASPTEPMPWNQRRHTLTVMYQGLANLEKAAKPSREDWAVCSDAVNMMETLVELGGVQDASGLLADAVAALGAAGQRHMDGGNIRLDARGMQAVRAILEDYAEAISVLSHRTIIRAHRATEKRIRDILKGRKLPHDVTVMAL